MTLTAWIREDLRARVLGGRGVPEPLTLRRLAETYDTSSMPVRSAVDALVREGVLERSGGGRLRAVPPRRPVATRPARRPRDPEPEIGREVMRRSLLGESGFLREEEASRRHRVGRTVLRRVFARLAAVGLLEHVPRRGWRVRPFREEDLRDYLAVRGALEGEALELARPRLVRADLRRMLGENRRRHGRWQFDTELHGYLLEKSGNRFIQDFFTRHGAYYTTLFHFAALGASVVERMAHHHRGILRAMLAGRWGEAKRLLLLHTRAQRPALRTMMKRLARLPVERWPELPLVEAR